MSDLDSYVAHCYDLMLKDKNNEKQQDEELCACAKLVQHDQKTN